MDTLYIKSTVQGAVYTCPNLRTNRRTIPFTICTQTEYGSNSSSNTHYNGLSTHFNKSK
jgi:hypothetical protein